MGLFTKKAAKIDQSLLDGQWSVATGASERGLMLLRCNMALKRVAGHADYGHRIGVAVPFQAPREDGMPGPSDTEPLNAIEDRLSDSLTAGLNCLPALVITTCGIREFVFYARDPQAAEAAIEQVRAGAAPYELQATVEADPQWQLYRDMRP